jgi:mannose-6-phosphate isomerase-like protein (cupin superfamily)
MGAARLFRFLRPRGLFPLSRRTVYFHGASAALRFSDRPTYGACENAGTGPASGVAATKGLFEMPRREEHMRAFGLSALALTLSVAVAHGQAGGAASPVAAPTGKAGYFANSDIQNIWKDLEARQVLNKRVLEGGTHSINVRIVTPKDAPLVHANSLDIWLVQAGSATAVTGGELLDAKKRPNSDDVAGSAIKGGTDQPLKPGDVLYVPPGVPHGFKDIAGFRAFLIRVDTK